LATLSLQATQDENAQQAANQRIESLLPLTTFGRDLVQKEAEFRAAAESLQEIGDSITHESLLDLFTDAPNVERVNALVQLTRPALDYTFFQQLTDRIETAEGDEKERLSALREQVLDLTQEIDKLQEARAQEAATLLRTLAEAEDLDQAILEMLPQIDELFLSILQANIRAAQERGDQGSETRLLEIDQRIREVIRDSLPAGLQLAQKVLEREDLADIEAILQEAAADIDQDMLGALMSTAQRLETAGNQEGATKIREIYRLATRISMKSKITPE
jgi:hypothetical protein